MNRELLGKRIRDERLKLNFTQESLAEDIDLTTSYVGQIERGERNITLENLVKIANRLGVTIDYLLSDSINAERDATLIQFSQLLTGRSQGEKKLAIDVIRMLFEYLDSK